MNNNNKSRLYLILTSIMTVIIWMNSMLPANISSTHSGFIVSIAQDILAFLNIDMSLDLLSTIIRKSAHFAQFFILGLLWFLSLNSMLINKRMVKWYALIMCLITAMIDESIQLFSVGRAFQFTDILIDFFGSTMAISALLFTQYLNKTKGEPI